MQTKAAAQKASAKKPPDKKEEKQAIAGAIDLNKVPAAIKEAADRVVKNTT